MAPAIIIKKPVAGKPADRKTLLTEPKVAKVTRLDIKSKPVPTRSAEHKPSAKTLPPRSMMTRGMKQVYDAASCLMQLRARAYREDRKAHERQMVADARLLLAFSRDAFANRMQQASETSSNTVE